MQPVSTFQTGVLHPFSTVVDAKPVQNMSRRNVLSTTAVCNTKHLQNSPWWSLALLGPQSGDSHFHTGNTYITTGKRGNWPFEHSWETRPFLKKLCQWMLKYLAYLMTHPESLSWSGSNSKEVLPCRVPYGHTVASPASKCAIWVLI